MSGIGRVRQPKSGPREGRSIARRYAILAILRSGRSSSVCRAWDRTLQRHVALKAAACPSLHPGSDDTVLHEAEVLLALRHPGVIPVVEAGRDDDTPFFVMPYVGGGTLEHRRPRRHDGLPLPGDVGELWHWLPIVAESLDHVHGRGYLHGDISLSNVLCDGTGLPMLIDFGSSRRATGGDDPVSDHRALAAAVGQWLAGEACSDLATRRPDLPGVVVRAVARGASSDIAERFPTCEAFAAAVLAATPRPTSLEKIQLVCPLCDRLLSVNPASVGKHGRCPRCGKPVTVASDLQSLETAAFRQTIASIQSGGSRGRAIPWVRIGRLGLLVVGLLAIVLVAPRNDAPPDSVTPETSGAPVGPPFTGGDREGPGAVTEPRPPEAARDAPAPAAEASSPTPAPRAAAAPSEPGEETVESQRDPPPEAVPTEAARLQVPSDDAIGRAVAGVRSAYADDYGRAAENGQAILLADDLLRLADESEDSTRRYAALLESERLSKEDGRIKDAVDAVRKRVTLYRCDPDASYRAVLTSAAGSRHLHSPGMFQQASDLGEDFLERENFALAREALALAETSTLHPGTQSDKNSASMHALKQRIDERERSFQEYVVARDQLAVDEANASASGTVGTYLCLFRQDWSRGIPYLAKSDLAVVSEIARRHAQAFAGEAPDAREVMAVADDWWRIAEGEIVPAWSGSHRAKIRQFAASLYASAAEGLVDPFERRVAAERAGTIVAPSHRARGR